MNEAELIQEFKAHGYKMTPQRREIIKVAACSLSHPSAEEIHQTVLEHMPDLSLATVYNTLRECVAIGVAREVNLGSDVRRYDFFPEVHAHFVCTECGEIKDAQIDQQKLAALFTLDSGCCPIRYELTVHGYCTNCARTGKSEQHPNKAKGDGSDPVRSSDDQRTDSVRENVLGLDERTQDTALQCREQPLCHRRAMHALRVLPRIGAFCWPGCQLPVPLGAF